MEQDPRNFSFSSDYPMPYFVYKTETSVTAQARATNTVILPHGLGCTPLLVGQWSPDQDFTTTHDIINRSVGDTSCACFADSTNIYVRQFNGSDSVKTIYVRLYAYPTPEYNGHTDSISDETAFNFDSDYAYLGLFMAGSVDGDNQTHVIQHNLGYVPQCKVWVEGSYVIDGGEGSVKAIGPASSMYYTDDPSPQYVVDKNNLTLGVVYAVDGKIYYHIYTNEV